MDELRRQVRKAQWRLTMQRFLGVLGWCWFATLLVAAALLLIDKYRPLGVLSWAWPVGALGLGLAIAVVWTFIARQRALGAAIEIDHRFGLKERVSSSLALSPAEHDTPAGRALVEDAVRRVGRIDVAEHFTVRLPRRALLPLLPGAVALLVALFVPPAGTENPAEANSDPPAVQKQVKRSTDELRRKLAERRKEAEKQDLQDAERLFEKLAKATEDIKPEKTDRKQVLVQMNDLTRELQVRKQQLDGAEQAKQQLEQLKGIERGPAEKFQQALGKGDFQQAMKELQNLKEQLEKAQLNDQQKDQLAKQLEAMQDKLQKFAEAQQAAEADLQQRAKQMREAGQNAEADKIEQQLNKLLQQMPQMQQMDDLAQQMGKCAKCLREGQDPGKALEGMQAGLNKLQQQLDEMEMVDGAMQQLCEAKEKMNQEACPFCGGAGCEKCDGPPGNGLGPGRGQGARPEAKTDTRFYDSQVRQKIGEGAADVAGAVFGPNVRGKPQEEIQQQIDAVKDGTNDPLSGRRLPRKHREHAQEYFDKLREGK